MDVFSELKASGRAALLMIILLVGVLLGANVVEYLCGTLLMTISFVGLAGLTLSIALRVDPTLCGAVGGGAQHAEPSLDCCSAPRTLT